MRENNWNVQVSGANDGTVSRLGIGHAWEWKRANGKSETFDCGMTISHVLAAMAVRIGLTTREIELKQT